MIRKTLLATLIAVAAAGGASALAQTKVSPGGNSSMGTGTGSDAVNELDRKSPAVSSDSRKEKEQTGTSHSGRDLSGGSDAKPKHKKKPKRHVDPSVNNGNGAGTAESAGDPAR